MRIAGIMYDSIVNGEGIRDVVFFQGCGKRCKGCHNPQSWDIANGTPMTTEEILEEIEQQIESIQYLRDHPEIAKHTILHETDEYCRGALSMLDYLKKYIELNK